MKPVTSELTALSLVALLQVAFGVPMSLHLCRKPGKGTTFRHTGASLKLIGMGLSGRAGGLHSDVGFRPSTVAQPDYAGLDSGHYINAARGTYLILT